MKKFKMILVALFAIVSTNAALAELTSEQLKFRNNIQSFLREEGFTVTIDDDDDSLNFKKEGTLYWITFGGSSPIYLEVHRAGLNCEDSDPMEVYEAINNANRKIRCAKAMYTGKSVTFACEIYCHTPEDFKYCFYKYMGELDSARDQVYDYYNNSGSSSSTGSSSRSSSSRNNAMSRLFPVYGLTLGTSNVNNLRNAGYNVETDSDGDHFCAVDDLHWWDHTGEGVFEVIYTTRGDTLPPAWTNNGLNWNMSYDQAVQALKNLGMNVQVIEAPKTKKYDGRNTLSADIIGTTSDGYLSIELVFDYGNSRGEGYSTSSRNSLYSMRFKTLE